MIILKGVCLYKRITRRRFPTWIDAPLLKNGHSNRHYINLQQRLLCTKPEIPPKPVEPDPESCCQNGCTTCVWELYSQEMEKWREIVEKLEKAAKSSESTKEKPTR
mmetsp:Transcript_31273/g.56767  ORF Transcript_31273/g.56767 Transcript_31273/m.56767 type:complete len:106 (+) Transcript_31273:51-368(+)